MMIGVEERVERSSICLKLWLPFFSRWGSSPPSAIDAIASTLFLSLSLLKAMNAQRATRVSINRSRGYPPLLHSFILERHSESGNPLHCSLWLVVRTNSPNFAQDSCNIEFDGPSRGNPGRAGAGAILRAPDNTVIFSSREGLGVATNNGDSQLVCKQVQGEWATRHPKMTELCGQAQELMSQFKSCDIQHVPREFNSVADAQASLATNLAEGERQEHTTGGYGRRGY
ncbi:Ribonuclease H-like domain protein [Raphanus sativus]|nr:Ribonuclease H-like domain protein [Raphanus sativus]